MPSWPFLLVLIALTVAELVNLAVTPGMTRGPGGRVFAFLVLFLIPGLVLSGGATAHLERSKTTKFCLSCHTMTPYGKSLAVDDKEFLAAQHYQNHRVPHDHACYTCHTDYAMFGDVKSKLRGLRHVIAYYSGSPPDTVKLYSPYKNRECLHCHAGSRSFEESPGHQDPQTPLDAIEEGTVSCLEGGCHDVAHGVDELADVGFWRPALKELPRE